MFHLSAGGEKVSDGDIHTSFSGAWLRPGRGRFIGRVVKNWRTCGEFSDNEKATGIFGRLRSTGLLECHRTEATDA